MSVIGIDVDGTLALKADFIAPDIIPDPNPIMVEVIKQLYADGHTLCIWTCRADYIVRAWLEEHALSGFFSYINESPYVTDSLKPSFDMYIGDEAIPSDGTKEDILTDVQYFVDQGHIGVYEAERDCDFSDHAPVAFYAGTGRMYIDMFEEAWRQEWDRKPPLDPKPIAFLTICSHAKPYSKSYIHSTIRKKLYENSLLHKVQYAHISTAGIIPSESEMVYPFNAYDHDGTQMTAAAKKHFSEVTYSRICDWLHAYADSYEQVVFYLRGEGKTYTAAVNAIVDTETPNAVVIGAEMSMPNLPWVALHDVDDCLTNEANLSKLIAHLTSPAISDMVEP